jgi:hypothetical protein
MIRFLCLTLLLPACIHAHTLTGSGHVVSKEITLSGFTKVEAHHAFVVTITQSAEYQTVIRMDDNLIQYLLVEKKGDTLVIDLDHLGSASVHGTLTASISMPRLEGLALSGATHATISGFKSDEPLAATLSGASSLEGDAERSALHFQLSGASQVSLKGSARSGSFDLSGASTLDLAAFPVDDAHAELSGASSATLHVKGKLVGTASGASRIAYLGDPQLENIHTSGASSIRRK